MIESLVNSFLKVKNYYKVKGENGDYSPLLPLLIMDTARTIWGETIRLMSNKGKAKNLETLWEKNYHKFNSDYFSCWKDKEEDFIISKMDEYEKYLSNYIVIANIQIQNVIINEPKERREIIANLMMVNILSQSALIVWNTVFTKTENPYLIGCKVWSYKLLNEFYGWEKENIDCNKDENVVNAVNTLCSKIVYWLKDERNKV